MEQKAKVLLVLEGVVRTIGTDYKSQEDCRKAITKMLNEVNELRAELEGKDKHYYRKTLLESIVNP